MASNTSVREALQWGIQRLKKAGVQTPVLDAESLLAHSSILRNRRIDRAWLYAHPEYILSKRHYIAYARMIARRTRREPVAYITGHKEFYGLDFLVNRNVLAPRPETELLVEQAICEIAKHQAKPWGAQGLALVDVGTGSGAIAVAVARRLRTKNPKLKVQLFATDIFTEALHVARKNARRQGVEGRIKFLKGDLLEPLLKEKNGILRPVQNATLREVIVVANLPYLPTTEWRAAMPEVRKWEPWQALDGGKDGLKYYRELFKQGSSVRGQVLRVVLCEICPEQVGVFQKMAREFFPRAKFEVIKDLAGSKRVVVTKIKKPAFG